MSTGNNDASAITSNCSPRKATCDTYIQYEMEYLWTSLVLNWRHYSVLGLTFHVFYTLWPATCQSSGVAWNRLHAYYSCLCLIDMRIRPVDTLRRTTSSLWQARAVNTTPSHRQIWRISAQFPILYHLSKSSSIENIPDVHLRLHHFVCSVTRLALYIMTTEAMSVLGDQVSPAMGSKKRKATTQSKFYAVRAGHKPGVYVDWNDCKESITGFKGANCECIDFFYHSSLHR